MRSKRRLPFLLVCFFLLFIAFAFPTEAEAAVNLTDINGHWAENYINNAIKEGFINGYPDGTFLPDKAITRAEFTSMVNKALGINGFTALNFVDVSYFEWYYNEISKAMSATYVAGYDDNTFRPNNPISRQEAAVMIARFVPAYGCDGNLSRYSDYRSIADWAYEAMEKINGKSYIGAYDDGKIHPLDQLTRAQAAKIIGEIVDEETIVTSDPIVKNGGTKLSGRIYSNNVTIHEDLGEDEASIDNCVILGNLYIHGGGEDTITINNSRISSIIVDKEDSSVRVLAKGETSVAKLTAHETSILQTSNLSGGLYGSGFNNISLSSSANSTLKGSFPLVNINGSSGKLTLESGSITTLNIAGNAKNADITISDGASVSKTYVNARSQFHGTGTITHMYVNTDDVTYEKKPKNWTIASNVDTPQQADPGLDIVFSPVNAATKVYLDTKITITFNTAMTKANGNSISNSDIEDFITLREDSKSGSRVDFTAAINSTKKVITITPDEDLEENTKYYVIIEEDSLKDTNGYINEEKYIYFTTGTSTAELTTTFYPANGVTLIPVMPSITISFSDSVVKYSNGASISSGDSYLEECIIFKNTNSSGSDVSYSASINSAKKTITITPDSNLVVDQKYYIAVAANKLKTSSGVTVPASSVTWTTGYTIPVLTGFTVSPGDTSITASMTPNVAGKVYTVALTSSSAAPTASQIAVGQNNAGAPAPASAKNENVSAGSSVTLPAMTGLASGVTYDIWAALYSSASGTFSTPVKVSTTTTLPKIYLTELSVKPVVSSALGNEQISFEDDTFNYVINLNSSIDIVRISAIGSGTISINGVPSTVADVTITDGSTMNIPVVISDAGRTSVTYIITVNINDDATLKSILINSNAQTISDKSVSFDLSTNSAIDVDLSITTNDPYATISVPSGTGVTVTPNDSAVCSEEYTLSIAAGTNPVTVIFTVTSGTKTESYLVSFIRPL